MMNLQVVHQILTGIGFGIIGFGIGFSEYFLALQRTAHFIKNEITPTFFLVFTESLWAWIALANFLSVEGLIAKIIVASLTALGGAIASIIVIKIKIKNEYH